MKKLTIDRSMWNTGERLFEESQLSNNYGQKCCLGFLGEACGIEEDDLQDESLPSSVPSKKWPKNLFRRPKNNNIPYASSWEDIFAVINDIKNIDHESREAWIKEGFKRILKYDVEFTGKYEE